MSHLKTTTITAAVVLAIAAIPFSRQYAEGSRIRSQLNQIEDRQSARVEGAGKSTRIRQRPERTTSAGSSGTRPAAGLLASLRGPADNRALIRAMMEGESLDENMAWGRIAEMSPDELKRLLDDVRDFPCDSVTKDILTSMIDEYGPEQPLREHLERMVAGGKRSTMLSPMWKWAASDPDAALKWYREKRASGELDPGLDDELHETVLTNLVRGLATSSPDVAFAFYRDMPREEMNGLIPRWLASDFARGMMESGDETYLVKMLDLHSGADRKSVLMGTFGEYARNGQFDAGLALVDKFNPVPEERNDYIGDLFSFGLHLHQVQGGLDWILTTTPEDEAPEVISRMIAGPLTGRSSEADQWLGAQRAGPLRDRGYAGLVQSSLNRRQFEEALGSAEQIDDATLRAASRQLVGRRWLERNRNEAEQGLPSDLLEQLQNQ